MIWIDGSSKAWFPLAEFELSPARRDADTQVPPTFKVRAHQTTGVIENKADEIRRQVQAHESKPRPVIEEVISNTEKHYFIPTSDADTIELVDHRKQKSTAGTDMLMTALIVAIFAGGLVGGRALFSPKSTVATSPTIRSASNRQVTEQNDDEHAAKASYLEPMQNAYPSIFTDSNSMSPDTTATVIAFKPAHVRRTTQQDSLGSAVVGSSASVSTTAPIETMNNAASTLPDAGSIEKDTQVPVAKKEIAKPVAEPAKNDDDAEKKKGFLRKLFGKKKKESDEKD